MPFSHFPFPFFPFCPPLHCILYTFVQLYCILYTLYCILYTLYCILYTIILYTAHASPSPGGLPPQNYPPVRTWSLPLLDFCIAQNHLKMCIWTHMGDGKGGGRVIFSTCVFGIDFGSLFGSSWDHFGALLGSFSRLLGPIFGSWLPFWTFSGRCSLFTFRCSLSDFRFSICGCSTWTQALRTARLNKKGTLIKSLYISTKAL